ncbi:MAG: hypothetical protein JRG82_19570, partial [Deltaproteobacteria bacterium]|nr:hypothetical protein [Deltaproteobacteria bacterium]
MSDLRQGGTSARSGRLRLLRSTCERVAADASLTRIVESHRRALESGDGVLKDRHGTAVTRVRADGGDLCVKQYRLRGWRDRLKAVLRPSPGLRAWLAAERVLALGVDTAVPVALFEFEGETWLVTRFIAGAVPLDRRLLDLHASGLRQDRLEIKRGLVRAVGEWLARVHSLDIDHDDCSAKNVLTAASEDGGDGWIFYLLDLDGARVGREPGYRRRVKNVAQLLDPPTGVTLTDRVRLLRAYAVGQ